MAKLKKLIEQILLGRSDADIGFDELAAVGRRRRQVLAAAGVGQLVEHRHMPVGMRLQRVADEIAADDPGAAGHQHVRGCRCRHRL